MRWKENSSEKQDFRNLLHFQVSIKNLWGKENYPRNIPELHTTDLNFIK